MTDIPENITLALQILAEAAKRRTDGEGTNP